MQISSFNSMCYAFYVNYYFLMLLQKKIQIWEIKVFRPENVDVSMKEMLILLLSKKVMFFLKQ